MYLASTLEHIGALASTYQQIVKDSECSVEHSAVVHQCSGLIDNHRSLGAIIHAPNQCQSQLGATSCECHYSMIRLKITNING